MVNNDTILNLSNNKGFIFFKILDINDSVQSLNVQFRNATQTAKDNYTANFGGFQNIIQIQGILYNDGTNKATFAGDSAVTVYEQWKYLKTQIYQNRNASDKQFDVSYQLSVNLFGTQEIITGNIEDININGNAATAGNRASVTISFNVGKTTFG